MKYEIEDTNDLNISATDTESSGSAAERPSHGKPMCLLHLLMEDAIEKGYPAHHFLADHRQDEYLPWWLEAMEKCGTCSTCKLLGPNPRRSHMEDLVEAMEADPEGMATLMANQPALPELPADFASPRMPWDTLH